MTHNKKTMTNLYTFDDYENAYYNRDVDKCKEIGCYLLSSIKDEHAKKLLSKLKKITYSWNMSEKKLNELTKLLTDVKIYLMVYN